MFNSLKLTAEQKLERAVTTIMRCKDLAFYASILFIGERKVVDAGNTYGCVTAMTNGKDEVYYRPFIDGLTDEELVFVILHECMHKLFRHTQLWGDLYSKDPLIANSACDFVVNLMLMDMWNGSAFVRKVMQPLMKDGEYNFLYDEKYRGMDAKEVFMSLYDDVPPPPPPPGEDEGEDEGEEGNDEGNNPSDDEGDDEGDEKGNAPGRKPDDDAEDGDGKGGDSGDSSDEDSDDADDADDGDGDTDDGEPTDKPPTTNDKRRELESKQFDQHKPIPPEERNAEEQQKLDIEIDRAIRNGMAIADKMGAHVPREIGELTEVKVDWCEVMREFVKQSHRGNDNATWRRFNRKLFVNDIYAPTYESERLGRIVVGIDTSGSINQQMINAMLTNVVSICDETAPEEVVLIYWDDAVQNVETYSESDYTTMIDTTKPAGGGGTDPKCMLNYLRSTYTESEIDCVIILTDGVFYDGQGDWSDYNVLWAIVNTGYDYGFVPDHGMMVKVEV